MIYIKGCQWFRQGKENKECKQARHGLNSSNLIVANNNKHFEAVALAA